MRLSALVLLAAAVAVPALAGPIGYDIAFTYSATLAIDNSGDAIAGLAAPTATFTYDADATPGTEFSNFIVTWGNASIDMTSAANAPALAYSPPTGCGAAPGESYGLSLIDQSVTGCTAGYIWDALYVGVSPKDATVGGGWFFFVAADSSGDQDQIGAPTTFPSDPSVPFEQAEGNWAVTPEPGTLVPMLLLALAAAGMKAGRRAL